MSQTNNRKTKCACGQQPDLYLIESFAIRRTHSDSSFGPFPVSNRSSDSLIDQHKNGKNIVKLVRGLKDNTKSQKFRAEILFICIPWDKTF